MKTIKFILINILFLSITVSPVSMAMFARIISRIPTKFTSMNRVRRFTSKIPKKLSSQDLTNHSEVMQNLLKIAHDMSKNGEDLQMHTQNVKKLAQYTQVLIRKHKEDVQFLLRISRDSRDIGKHRKYLEKLAQNTKNLSQNMEALDQNSKKGHI